jgi:hypothetical protein
MSIGLLINTPQDTQHKYTSAPNRPVPTVLLFYLHNIVLTTVPTVFMFLSFYLLKTTSKKFNLQFYSRILSLGKLGLLLNIHITKTVQGLRSYK